MAPRRSSSRSIRAPTRFEAGPASASEYGDAPVTPRTREPQASSRRSSSRRAKRSKSPTARQNVASSGDAGAAGKVQRKVQLQERSIRRPALMFAVCCVLTVLVLTNHTGSEGVVENSAGKGKDGFYGCPDPEDPVSPRCSNIDWCEENYMYMGWLAEPFNTFSSALYVVFSSFGALAYFWEPIDRWATGLGYVILLVTGWGSMCFHGTLLRSFQLFDEVPMLFLVSVFLYATLTIEPGGKLKWWDVNDAPASAAEARTRDPYGCMYGWQTMAATTKATKKDEKGSMGIPMESPRLWLVVFGASAGVSVACARGNFALFGFSFASAVFASVLTGIRRFSRLRSQPETQDMAAYSVMCFSIGGIVWGADHFLCDLPVAGLKISQYVHPHLWWHLFSSLAGHYALQYYLRNRLLFRGVEVTTEYRMGLHFARPLDAAPATVPSSSFVAIATATYVGGICANVAHYVEAQSQQ